MRRNGCVVVFFAWLCASSAAQTTTANGIDLVVEVKKERLFYDQVEATASALRAGFLKVEVPYTLKVEGTRLTVRILEPSRLVQARAIIEALNAEFDGPKSRKYDIDHSASDTITLTVTETFRSDDIRAIAETAREVIAKRLEIAPDGVKIEGKGRIILRHSGKRDYGAVLRAVMPAPKLSFRLVAVIPEDEPLPDDVELLEQVQKADGAQSHPIAVEKHVLLDGETIKDTSWFNDQNTGRVAVTIRLDETGAKTLAHITKANFSKQLAIVMGRKVLTAPTIYEPILGGTAVISENFTIQSANDLAVLLRAGASPPPVIVVRCALQRDDGSWEPCTPPDWP